MVGGRLEHAIDLAVRQPQQLELVLHVSPPLRVIRARRVELAALCVRVLAQVVEQTVLGLRKQKEGEAEPEPAPAPEPRPERVRECVGV